MRIGSPPGISPGIGVKGRASSSQPSVPIGTAFYIDWIGLDDFNSGGLALHPQPNEFMTDRQGLWLFDVSVKFRAMPDGSVIDNMILQLEADGSIINDSSLNSDYLHFPSLTYKMPAGVRLHAVALVQSSSASVVLIDANWKTYFAMTYLGPT